MDDDDRFLAAMGLKGLEGDEKQEALASILNTINIKVGMRVMDQLTDEQAEEFERLSAPGADVEKLVYWIALNAPNHKQLIEEETKKLRDNTVNFVDEQMKASQNKGAAN